MMTFKEYLVETAITALQNKDALARGNTDFKKLALGKHDGSKPSEKRASQVDKRSRRARGYSEEEEQNVDVQLKKFFANNPNPSDDEVHALASDLGIEHSKLEERIYRLLHKQLSSEEEEEPGMPATRDRVQGIANTPNEIGRRPSSKREFQRMQRRVKRTRGIGSDSKGAMSIDDL